MAEPNGGNGKITEVRLRSYQQEMLERSMERNVIVAMETGSGKTHIAVARIRAELERQHTGKLIWFLTPNKALSEQQYTVLQDHLPAYHIRSLTGADEVEKWTDRRLWDAFLHGTHVVVGTPACLADALTHGFVKIARLSLLVFDEAHRCTGNHPMNRIMREFYYPAKEAKSPTPHVLGLSASPVMSTKANSLEKIESNLDAVTATPKIHRTELAAHVRVPVLLEVNFPDPKAESESKELPVALSSLSRIVGLYDIHSDPYIQELEERGDPKSYSLLERALDKRKTYCLEQLRTLKSRATSLNEQLGGGAADWYIHACLQRFRAGKSDLMTLLPDLSEKENEHLLRIFEQVRQNVPEDATVNICGLSKKVQALCRVLLEHAAPGFRSIVFVEQRAAVTAMAKMLGLVPEVASKFKIGTFVGTSTSSSHRGSIADIVDLKAQFVHLEDFRNGEKNLMIATNVLEEGIDIPACSGVICFDLPQNLVSFIQRRGRARMADSKYTLFISDSDLRSNPARFQQMEAAMRKAYMDDTREPAAQSEGDDDEEMASIQYRVPSTGALLTMDNAKAHLFHFCAVSTRSAGRYIDARPEFDVEGPKPWTATVTLPAFVHPGLRTATGTRYWRSEAAAVKDAAYNAYIVLHNAGLVNDNLLPTVQDQGPEPGSEHVDQPSVVQIAERQSSWSHPTRLAAEDSTEWLPARIRVKTADEEIVSEDLWIPTKFPNMHDFDLHWNTAVKYSISVDASPQTTTIEGNKRKQLALSTRLFLDSVHSNRSSIPASEYAFFVGPADVTDLEAWLAENEGSEAATSYFEGGYSGTDHGLVRIQGQPGRAFIFQERHERAVGVCPETETSPTELELAVTVFPKRRDFLHKPRESETPNVAHSARQILPISECTVDRLPAKHSLFAAFLPSILHRIDIAMLAEDLQNTLLSPTQLVNTALVIEAISAPSAGEVADYNRLEFLGDTILKFCTELQVMAQHPTWPEAYLSVEKDHVVRNNNLAQVALAAGLDRYILTKPFTGAKWRPPSMTISSAQQADNWREISSKVLADVVEALIGAAYVDGGLSKGHACIRALICKEEWWNHSAIFSQLHEQLDGQQIPSLTPLEDLIGHHFTRPALLLEAITHASAMQTRGSLSPSYERLEFLGDAVLDLVVTPKLFAHPRRLRHWELHRIHEALVNAHFLGYCCMTLTGSTQHFGVVNMGTARDAHMQLREGTSTYHLYDFLRAGGEVIRARKQAVLRFDKARESLAKTLSDDNMYPWPELVALCPEKFLSDMVESIMGALYLDTCGDLSVCERFAKKLGILPMMKRILDEGVETAFPKERLGILADQDAVLYIPFWREDDTTNTRSWECVVKVGGLEIVKVDGCGTKEEAEVRGAHVAAQRMMDSGKHWGKKKRKLDVRIHTASAQGGAAVQ